MSNYVNNATIRGIDVSEHNGTLNWEQLKSAGIRFAIIRSGYGVRYEDPQLKANVEGCIRCGIPFGIYHFSYATSEAGARAEADFCAGLLERWKDRIALPVYYDLEYDSVRYAADAGVNLDRAACTAHVRAFTGRMKDLGWRAGVYFNLDYRNRMLDLNTLKDCSLWYANWSSGVDWGGYDIWQYTSGLTLAGHSCRFDANLTTAGWLAEQTGGTVTEAAAGNAGNNGNNGFDTAKTWRNGSTTEPVYADTDMSIRIGSLNPWEKCDCIGRAGALYAVRYLVDGTADTYKVGLVAYAGGLA